jgi:hypothetical protein
MWRRAIEDRMVWKLGAALKTQSITDRSNDYWLVYRVEDVDCCYMYSTPWQQEHDYAKAHQDELRTRRSRFAGTLVRRDLRQGRVASIPYEVERKWLARRLGDLLKSRMFDTCYRWPAESLAVSPSIMAKDYLGCSMSALVEKFENQMQPGMNWDNFGARGWVIDHIYPVSLLDFRKISHVRKACHYSNLRPCWEAENIRKGARTLQEVHA